jgi:hypothetical protein
LTLLDVVANAEPGIAALRPSLRRMLDNAAPGLGPLKTTVAVLPTRLVPVTTWASRYRPICVRSPMSIAKVPFDAVALADRLLTAAQALTLSETAQT